MQIIKGSDKTYRIGKDNQDFIEVDERLFATAKNIFDQMEYSGGEPRENKIRVIRYTHEVLISVGLKELSDLKQVKDAVDALFATLQPLVKNNFDGKPILSLKKKVGNSEYNFAVYYEKNCPYTGAENNLRYSLHAGYAYLDDEKARVLGWDNEEHFSRLYIASL